MNTGARILSLTGLAMKAGKIASGETAVLSAIASKEARLVLVAKDASAGSKKLFTDKCRYRDIPCVLFGDKEGLGLSIGRAERSAVAVTDDAFAAKIGEMIRAEASQ